MKPLNPTELVAKPHSEGIYIEWLNPDKHIDNSPFFDFSHIAVYVDSQLVTSVKDGITTGERSNAVIKVTTEKFYHIFIKAVGKRGDIETESEPSEVLFTYAGAPLENFADNFDVSEKRLPHFIVGDWALTDKKAKSEPYSLTDTPEGNYAPGETSIIFAPTVIKEGKTTLSFDHIALIDIGAGDNGVIAISNDFGNIWKHLRWVDRNTSPKFTGSIQDADWDYLGINLEDFIGDTIYIRFILFANFFRHDDGWYIDNLEIGDKPVSVDYENLYSALLKMEISPNPASELINLRLVIPARNKFSVKIFDLFGNSLLSIDERIYEAGEYSYKININALSSGLYYCVLNSGTYIKTVPIIIER